MLTAVKEKELQPKQQPLMNTTISGLAVLLIFLVIFFVSGPFEYDANQARPILLVVGLLILASILAFAGISFARQVPKSQHKKLMTIIFGLALSIRLVALFTPPILEIDYYRYIWDGKVVCEGVSPYRYSPAQVLDPSAPSFEDLDRLTDLSIRSESNHVILSRIHYENYTTLYPPVSQLVFAAAMKLTPDSASVEAQVIAMKIALTLFDLGTMLLLGGLLYLARVHPGWLIAYAWNPLVIKEIANSGHLDSIATFLVVLTLFLIARQGLFRGTRFSRWSLPFAGVALGLGVGAKLFPVVFFPVLLVTVIRKNSHFEKRWLAGATFSLAFAMTASLALLPMFYRQSPSVADQSMTATEKPVSSEQTKSQDGFGGFFSSWRMNDPIFSTVYLNLKNRTSSSKRPWFVATTEEWRSQLNEQWRGLGFAGKDPAYSMTRILTMGLFSCLYLWQLGKLYYNEQETEQWVVNLASRMTFILALFLFLQPTVNPWYCVWVAPLICLTKNRGWLLASGIMMLYYSRFWFKSLAGTYAVAGHNFDGVKLFDHCFVFVEFGLIVTALIYFSGRKSRSEPDGLLDTAA